MEPTIVTTTTTTTPVAHHLVRRVNHCKLRVGSRQQGSIAQSVLLAGTASILLLSLISLVVHADQQESSQTNRIPLVNLENYQSMLANQWANLQQTFQRQQQQRLEQQQQQQHQRNARFAPPPPPPPPPAAPMGLGAGVGIPPRMITVPGVPPFDPGMEIIMPNDTFSISDMDESEVVAQSYVIDSKRYVEAMPMRCFASTILDEPSQYEPSFVLIRPQSEVRLNATVPPELIQMAGFDPTKRTTIFVHGFTQSYPSTLWLRRVRALFELNSVVERQNLIIMDWGIASQGQYSQVAARVSGVGAFLANFIMKLIQLGSNRMGIHVIGHSLGAHVAGFAGKRIRPRLGRITGLDAAGPCFGKIFSNGPQDRLSADDAYEVDVYHYDDEFLGLPGQIGQFDVFVNGGSSQPGCTDNMNAVFQALITMVFRRNRVLSESHTRSTEVPAMQLSLNGCQQVAYECRDYSSFMLGECGSCDDQNNQCFFMGFDFQYRPETTNINELVPLRTSFPGKRFYITTAPNELYCLHHYQIVVRFDATPELAQASKRMGWRLQMELVNDLGKRIDVSMTNQMAPGVFTYLLLTEAQPARVKLARMQVRASDGSLLVLQNPASQKKSPFRVQAVEVNFMSNVNPIVRRSLSSRLCPVVNSAAASSAATAFMSPFMQQLHQQQQQQSQLAAASASADGNAPSEINSIEDSSDTTSDTWNLFGECLM